MTENSLDEMAQFVAADGDAHLKRRLEREQKSIARSRRIRVTLHWSIVSLSLVGLALFWSGSRVESQTIAVIGFLCLLPVVPCAFALWVMGGMVPDFVRRWLSDREKAMVDD
ncbi:MAG TPA: hypothetical protein VGX78_07970 [Pirellulales bacterium]|nr:hypothetical protein [Pirellulales bacterium]